MFTLFAEAPKVTHLFISSPYYAHWRQATCILYSLCMFCSVYSVFILPTGTLQLLWQVFPCFFLRCKANARV